MKRPSEISGFTLLWMIMYAKVGVQAITICTITTRKFGPSKEMSSPAMAKPTKNSPKVNTRKRRSGCMDSLQFVNYVETGALYPGPEKASISIPGQMWRLSLTTKVKDPRRLSFEGCDIHDWN